MSTIMMYHKDLLLYQSSRRWGVCFSFACVCHDVAMFAAIAAVRENSCRCHFETLRTNRQRFGIMLWNFSDGSTLQLERGARYAVLVNHYFTVYFMWFASGWQGSAPKKLSVVCVTTPTEWMWSVIWPARPAVQYKPSAPGSSCWILFCEFLSVGFAGV